MATRRKIIPALSLLTALAVLASLSIPAACSSTLPAATEQHTTGLVLELTPGPDYAHFQGWFIFGYTVYPQVAVWIEDADGRFVRTIHVTEKAVKENWIAAPAAGRPEALPVWSSREREALTDGTSCATPVAATTRSTDLSGLAPGRYRVVLESNRSYDYNSAYPESTSGVNGQPSVLWEAWLELGAGPAEADFMPIGTGSPDGTSGEIRKGLEGIDTALSQFSVLRVRWEPQATR